MAKNARNLVAGRLLAETRERLARSGLHPRKSLGQHFLIDQGVLDVILTAAELTEKDTVLEVGPGLGILTRELARRVARVIAVELDDNLAGLLAGEMAGQSNVTVINADILKLEITGLLATAGMKPLDAASYKVTANLPYYITAPVLRHLLEAPIRPQVMIVMVQREVAEAIAAPDRMGLLGISVRFYGVPEIVEIVPAHCFYPMPGVDSAILRINVSPRPVLDTGEAPGFFSVVRAGFAAPRKLLTNSLAQGLGVARIEAAALLEQAGISGKRRAETLAVADWVRLWRGYKEREHVDASGAGED
jgi:16S rRNA (adenine1518-N6/adenine1519-N6)-dimethyltransferase